METSRSVLALKGYNYGIPNNILDKAFNDIINYIEYNIITTIVIDGDLLPYVSPNSSTGELVKSYTLLIPRIYEWSVRNNYNIEFIYCKKEKSINNLLDGGDRYFDNNGIYVGPYNFLNEENIEFLDEEMEITPLNWGINLALSVPNESTYLDKSLRFMKWLKKSRIDDICIYIIGDKEYFTEELENLKSQGDMVPNPNIISYNFEQTAIK